MEEIGRKLIEDMKTSMIADHKDEQIERKDFQHRDLLSLLVKSNMSTDIPEGNRMSNEEIIARRFLSVT